MSTKRLFCDNWEFSKNPFGTEYADTLDFIGVDIPHDWLIYDTKNLYETSTGWYRKHFIYTKAEECVSLRFEGVYMDSKVYVNGTLAGEWKYGYSTFEFDITKLLVEGDNLITVRVDHREPNSRWYSGAGIYRNVWLKTYPKSHLVADGIYISAEVDGKVTVTAEVERPEGEPVAGLTLCHRVFDGEKEVARVENACCAFDKSCMPEPVVQEGCVYSVNTDYLQVENPVLWDIENPKCYTCITELVKDGAVIDTEKTVFGFRKAVFTTDKGFFLNDKHVKLHGCCEHHDLGSLGAAMHKTALKRKLESLRVMGINAIRTSHNMPAVELMELADEMGFLILSEGFDMWELPKTTYDYARFFPTWIKKDVASWVRRDRNHPSLIGWSIGNEIYDTHASERGQEVTSMLMKLVQEHDFRKNGYVTIGSNYMQSENGQKCADIVKLAGYNYGERLYEEQHKAHPDWMIYGSETASVVQSRGIYHFPLSQSMLANDDEQCSSLGNCSTGWGAKNTEDCIIKDRDAEYCAGQFIWTGFDYIGEPTPYSTKNSYFGQIDTAGFFKDSAYVFRAEWTDYKKSPFVHIFPYWDFNEGEDIDVRVTSNAPKVALFFNGEEIGVKEIDHLQGKELTLDVIIPYKKGELCAVAYDENGTEIARDCKKSFGDTATLELSPDKTVLKADGEDLVFIDISAYDENGEFVANANNRVFVNVTGAGRLIGLDNGDSTDFEQYKGTSRRLFSGKLLAIVAAKTKAGTVEIKVNSPGLEEKSVTLQAVEAPVREGISANTENAERKANCPDVWNDIPVRKIALSGESTVFTKDCTEKQFKVMLSPANTTYADEIEYRITTVLGIASNLAEITNVENNVLTVRCKGDGEFYLRALCKNGTDKYHVISTIKLCGEGIGSAFFNPYELVMGGLYTQASENIQNGIKHGAKFAGESSWFAFDNVDFGKVGSDTVTFPIFANCANAVDIRVYDGIPGCGGELIGEFSYQKKSIWLTYIPETYKLNKVLKGVHTIAFESAYGYDIQGFFFAEQKKEFTQLSATDNEGVYGDKFTVTPDAVTGIGNNVFFEFGTFDFTEETPSQVVITGKSDLPVNSIHLMVKGDIETRYTLEFAGAKEYTERVFPIEGLKGKCQISFVFLPGSDFDFKAFRFVK